MKLKRERLVRKLGRGSCGATKSGGRVELGVHS